MSQLTRRKHVLKEMQEDDFELPKDNQQIVRVVRSRGNNLHEVETANSHEEHFLVTMPTKFRKNVWIKRGDYILIEPIEEGDKVKGEICKILTPAHIKEYAKASVWPEGFTIKNNGYVRENVIENNEFEDSDVDDLEPNMNRPVQRRNIRDSSDDDDDDDDDDDEEDDEYSSSENEE